MNTIQRMARRFAPPQIHAIGALAIALTLVAAIAAATPAWSARSRQGQLDLTLRAAAQRLASSHARLDQLERQLASAQSPAADEPAVNVETFDRRLLDVSAAAADSGVLVDSIEPGATVSAAPGSSGGRSSISIAARGPYPKLVGWIHALRDRAPDLTVRTVQITAAADGACVCRLALEWWAPPAQLADAREASR